MTCYQLGGQECLAAEIMDFVACAKMAAPDLDITLQVTSDISTLHAKHHHMLVLRGLQHKDACQGNRQLLLMEEATVLCRSGMTRCMYSRCLQKSHRLPTRRCCLLRSSSKARLGLIPRPRCQAQGLSKHELIEAAVMESLRLNQSFLHVRLPVAYMYSFSRHCVCW